jgi:hypothetical protein
MPVDIHAPVLGYIQLIETETTFQDEILANLANMH